MTMVMSIMKVILLILFSDTRLKRLKQKRNIEKDTLVDDSNLT